MLCQPASEFLPVIEEAHGALVERVEASIPGAKVENNKFCLSVHFRCVDEKVGNALPRLGMPATSTQQLLAFIILQHSSCITRALLIYPRHRS